MRFKVSIIAFLVMMCSYGNAIAYRPVASSHKDGKAQFMRWVHATNGITRNFGTYKDLTFGMHAYSLSVMHGTRREAGLLSYAGTVENPFISQAHIMLFRVGPPLAHVCTVAGMSGSPVYAHVRGEWRLLGAYAYGMNQLAPKGEFLVGVTPIQDMLDQNAALHIKASGVDVNNFLRHFQKKSVVSLPGFGRCAIRSLLVIHKEANEISAPQSETSRQEAIPRPGDAISAVLADGDFTMYATGTITYVDTLSNRFVAFGHPFLADLGLGPMEMPAYHASIATTSLGYADSYKMPERLLEHFGTIYKDGIFGIEGRYGSEDHSCMMPVSLKLDVDGKVAAYHFGVVRQRALSRLLMVMGLSNLSESIISVGNESTLRMDTSVLFKDRTPFSFSNSALLTPVLNIRGITVDPVALLFGTITGRVGALIASEWNFNIAEVDIAVTVRSGVKKLWVDSCCILDKNHKPVDEVQAGENYQLLLLWRDFRGEKKYKLTVPFRVPDNLDFSSPIPSLLISVASGSQFRDLNPEHRINHTADTPDEFLKQLLNRGGGAGDPQKVYVQFVYPPTELPYRERKIPVESESATWEAVPSLDPFRESKTETQEVELQIFSCPLPDYILDEDKVLTIPIQK
ncbi:MAG: hypothetical protein KGI50_03510 [Patescibacteria group bacterium]|nr:hypothetical protein [Patescibacteria group bacterium]MDE2438358.1 hypothetical protein [Patescibacteria group bacterium]